MAATTSSSGTPESPAESRIPRRESLPEGDTPTTPGLRPARTTFRSQTPRRSQTSQQYNPNASRGRRWQPGLEPGIDPNAINPGSTPHLQTECEITLVEFSQDRFDVSYYDNSTLIDLLSDLGKASPTACKWVNINGLSWDVISALAKVKGFQPLAIEDVLSRKNRTKADWYSDHAYIVLPLQKLIHIDAEQKKEEDQGAGLSASGLSSLFSRKRRKTPAKGVEALTVQAEKGMKDPIQDFSKVNSFAQLKRDDGHIVRTLQRYHGGLNEDRIDFMEHNSALRAKNLGVSVEQVSIFLMADNTAISFFEHSAADIETPILNRLMSPQTILRRSSEASMMVQAVIDACIDLALPVTAAYQDAIDELEINVLTAPALKHTSSLYIIRSEVSQFRATIAPVGSLIDALRDHSKSAPAAHDDTPTTRPVNLRQGTGLKSMVSVSPVAKTYLADVGDHVQVVVDTLEQMRRAADNMTDLIFNTISAYQNETMRQLTTVTILFLPLSFMSGYFGMNFVEFDFIHEFSDAYFWAVALPVVAVIAVWVLRDNIARWWTAQKAQLRIRMRRRWRENKVE